MPGGKAAGCSGPGKLKEPAGSCAWPASLSPVNVIGEGPSAPRAIAAPNVSRDVAVDFSTADGSALAGSDDTGISGTVSIPAGRASATFNVPVAGDTVIEGDETFSVNLTRPVNAVIGDALAVGTIANDDSPPSAIPVFNSLPGAVAVAYLDMDGQVVSGTRWAGGATIAARGFVGTLTNAQMIEVCRRTAEDYPPFEINLTTEESVYLAAPANRRIRCIITPDNEWSRSAATRRDPAQAPSMPGANAARWSG